ncbi:MAG TPA: hypothetical protein VK889_03915 [Solirubrobacterales bacterium]|nr:hypothetical protein [Solirubrobacterales bacterium]
MTRSKALLLFFACVLLFETVVILGLVALGANEATVGLGYIVTLVLGSLGSAEIVMRYD